MVSARLQSRIECSVDPGDFATSIKDWATFMRRTGISATYAQIQGIVCTVNARLDWQAKPRNWLAAVVVLLLLIGCASDAAGPDATVQGGNTLSEVKERNLLIVGIDGSLPGFSDPAIQSRSSAGGDAQTGMDVDLGLALAAAIFGNEKPVRGLVQFRPTSTSERFDLLIKNQVDVLFRNSTWVLTRDTNNMRFSAPYFYDGQGFMIGNGYSGTSSRLDLSADSLGGASICVRQGTTTESNLTDFFLDRSDNLGFTPLSFSSTLVLQQAFSHGRCDAWTTDRSGLAGQRSKFLAQGEKSGSDRDGLVILPDVISKEPLAPVTRETDPNWSTLVDTVVRGLVAAEALGITKAGVADADALETTLGNMPLDDRRAASRLLGQDNPAALNHLGVRNDYILSALREVGNYGEIYARHLTQSDQEIGPDLGVSRGSSLNAAWPEGLQLGYPVFSCENPENDCVQDWLLGKNVTSLECGNAIDPAPSSGGLRIAVPDYLAGLGCARNSALPEGLFVDIGRAVSIASGAGGTPTFVTHSGTDDAVRLLRSGEADIAYGSFGPTVPVDPRFEGLSLGLPVLYVGDSRPIPIAPLMMNGPKLKDLEDLANWVFMGLLVANEHGVGKASARPVHDILQLPSLVDAALAVKLSEEGDAGPEGLDDFIAKSKAQLEEVWLGDDETVRQAALEAVRIIQGPGLPELRRLLGVGNFQSGLNTVVGGDDDNAESGPVQADFMVQILEVTGNYDEIWDTHLGIVGVQRDGANALRTAEQDGLLYPIPYS